MWQSTEPASENWSVLPAFDPQPKKRIVEAGLQQHLLNEVKVMQMLDHPMICRLHSSFQDDTYIYFALEPCMGGELFTHLRNLGTSGPSSSARLAHSPTNQAVSLTFATLCWACRQLPGGLGSVLRGVCDSGAAVPSRPRHRLP